MNGRPWAALVVGALLVLLGIAWLLAAADVYELDVRVALGAVLVVIGLAVMLLPRGHGVLVVLAIPLLLFHDPLFGVVDCQWLGTILINVAAVLTVVSMLYYLRKALPHASLKA